MTTVEQSLATTIAEHYARVRDRVATAAARAGRNPADVRIVGVTKGFSVETIRAAWSVGLREFGENRVQEAEEKYAALFGKAAAAGHNEIPGARLRIIGHLQSNKAKRATQLADCIETIDSLRLAERLDRLAAKEGKRLDVMIQINVSGAESQEGVELADAPALARDIVKLRALRLVGLMTIGTNTTDEATVRRDFTRVRELRDHMRDSLDVPGFGELSMGMSGDFELAVEEGSTSIRLGRVLFGERLPGYRLG